MKGLEPIDAVKKRLGMLKNYSKAELAHKFGVSPAWITRKIQALHEHDYDRRSVPGSVAWEVYLSYLYHRQLIGLETRQRVGAQELRKFFDAFDEQSDSMAAQKEYALAMGGSWDHCNLLLTEIEMERGNVLGGRTISVFATAA
ncbi:MAG: hypothetical protein AAGA46_03415 [Cyanobacteria bacterium P01_F01_bin.13]